MGLTDRDWILTRIEGSLGRMNEKEVPLVQDRIVSPPEWLQDDVPWDEAEKELELLSDRFHLAGDEAGMRRILKNIVREHDVTLAVQWEHSLLQEAGIEKILGEMGVKVAIPSREEEWKEVSARAQLGITAADAIIMESGTLVLRASKEQGRSTSLLPPVHLAIVRADQRLRSLGSLPGLCRSWAAQPQGLPSAVALVTGHSRTADIELTLVSGVHGPRVVHVVGLKAG